MKRYITLFNDNPDDHGGDGNPLDFLADDGVIKEEKKEEKKEDKKEEKDPPAKVLRQERDKLKLEKEKIESRLKELEELAPLKTVADYIKTKNGKLDEESINEYIDRNKKRKSSLSEFEKKLKEKDERIKEFDIVYSDEWKEEYQKPINDANQYLIATIVKLDDNKKVMEPELHTALLRELVAVNEKGEAKTPVEIRQSLKTFAETFEKKTGVEWDVPSLQEVVKSISSVHNSIIKAEKAKADWASSLENKKKERIFDESKKQEAFVKKEKENRNYIYDKVVEESGDIINILSNKDSVLEALKSEHSNMIDVLVKKEGAKPKNYKQFLEMSIKANAFDVLKEEHAKLKAENEQLQKDLNSSLPYKGKGKEKSEYKESADESPTAFLQ